MFRCEYCIYSIDGLDAGHRANNPQCETLQKLFDKTQLMRQSEMSPGFAMIMLMSSFSER